MSAVIHKQRLDYSVWQGFRSGGRVYRLLTVQVQDGVPCLWYEIEPDAGPSHQSEIHVMIVGTGFEVPEDPYRYVATTQRGTNVWHWYAYSAILRRESA